jgi:MFS superfamily sulfate permease-like transporter
MAMVIAPLIVGLIPVIIVLVTNNYMFIYGMFLSIPVTVTIYSLIFTKEEPTSSNTFDTYGNGYWYNKKGELHRDNDKPAIIYSNVTKC